MSLFTDHQNDAWWEQDLPVNPPGFFDEGFDVFVTEAELANCEGEDGPEYRHRPRIRVPSKIRRRMISADEEDLYDCD